jgi:hypothetical protein
MAWPAAVPSLWLRPQLWLRETARPSLQDSLTLRIWDSVTLLPRVTPVEVAVAVNQPRFVPVLSARPVLSAQPVLWALPQLSLWVVELKPPRLSVVDWKLPWETLLLVEWATPVLALVEPPVDAELPWVVPLDALTPLEPPRLLLCPALVPWLWLWATLPPILLLWPRDAAWLLPAALDPPTLLALAWLTPLDWDA